MLNEIPLSYLDLFTDNEYYYCANWLCAQLPQAGYLSISNMYTAFRLLLTAMLLMNAAFGCCHAQSAECRECVAVAEHSTKTTGCCRGADCRQPKKDVPKAPCKCQVACAGVCTYLPPQKVHVEAPRLAVPFDFVAVIVPTCISHECIEVRVIALSPSACAPAVRRHLLLQVLLT